MKRPLKKFLDIYLTKEVATEVSALSFATLLSLVPTISLSFWYLHRVGVTDRGTDLFKEFLVKHLNVQSSSVLLSMLDNWTSSGSRSWGVISIVVFCYTAIGFFLRLGDSLDKILSDRNSVKWYWLWAKRAVITILLPIPLVLSMMVFQWVKADSILHSVFEWGPIGPGVAFLVPLLADILLYFSLFFWIPATQHPASKVFFSALVVAVSTEVVRYVFQYYSSYSLKIDKLYGVFAILPLFIIWIQIHWTLILGGAVLLRVLSPRRVKGDFVR